MSRNAEIWHFLSRNYGICREWQKIWTCKRKSIWIKSSSEEVPQNVPPWFLSFHMFKSFHFVHKDLVFSVSLGATHPALMVLFSNVWFSTYIQIFLKHDTWLNLVQCNGNIWKWHSISFPSCDYWIVMLVGEVAAWRRDKRRIFCLHLSANAGPWVEACFALSLDEEWKSKCKAGNT